MATVEKQARAISFDFLGYGLSYKPHDGAYSLFAQADLVEQIASHLGVGKCLVVSNDMGDTVAVELMARNNEDAASIGITGVILTNGSIFIDEARLTPGQLGLLAMPDEPLQDSPDPAGLRAGLSATFPAHRRPSEVELDSLVWLLQFRGGGSPDATPDPLHRRAAQHQDRWTDGLVDFGGPLVALWGELDPIALPSMPRRLLRLRPDTEIVIWPDVGHWPAIEAPDRVAAAILGLMSRPHDRAAPW